MAAWLTNFTAIQQLQLHRLVQRRALVTQLGSSSTSCGHNAQSVRRLSQQYCDSIASYHSTNVVLLAESAVLKTHFGIRSLSMHGVEVGGGLVYGQCVFKMILFGMNEVCHLSSKKGKLNL